MRLNFSLARTWALIIKEVKELLRDPFTAAMIFFIPLFQTVLFSYAINNNPKHLPTVIVNANDSEITRSLINDLQITSYFNILTGKNSPEEIEHLFRSGKTLFAIYLPPNFTKELIRGTRPQIMIDVDAIDPAATSYALSAFSEVMNLSFKSMSGSLDYLNSSSSPIDVVVHPKYNPNRNTQYNIVPGLLSAVLTLTLVLVTALAVVREREAGTMEILLTTPARPMEIVLGKIIPFIGIAYIQTLIILALAVFLFNIPIYGSLTLLLACSFPFIIANLAIGIMVSTIASNQIQAAQATSCYFIPSMLFSGFMFPFSGLPTWGKFIGNLLPSTHYLVIVRGIMLKGSTLYDIYPNVLAIIAIIVVLIALAITRFHKTLD
jgi:ABC-2 type transport system permease protein